MGLVNPQQSNPNDTIEASDINNPVNQLAAVINGNIDSSNLAASAVTTSALADGAVTPSKLATGAAVGSVSTSETTTSTSYVDLPTTTDTVTVTIGANGLALVALSCTFGNSGTNYTNVSFAASGANTIAAADSNAIAHNQASLIGFANVFLLTGLNAGSTTFKMKYNVVAGTGTFKSRRISVVPL